MYSVIGGLTALLVAVSSVFLGQFNRNKAEIQRLLKAANDLKNMPQDAHLRVAQACARSMLLLRSP